MVLSYSFPFFCADTGEKEQRLEREKKAEKHKRKIERQAAAGVVKKKTKGIRIRKGVRIRVRGLAGGLYHSSPAQLLGHAASANDFKPVFLSTS